jgi:glutamine synthetase
MGRPRIQAFCSSGSRFQELCGIAQSIYGGGSTMLLIEQLGLDTSARREQAREALARIQQSVIRYLRVVCPDLMGVLRGKTVGTNQMEKVFADGCNFGARILLTDLTEHVHPSVHLGDRYDFGNCYLLPDPGTFVILPWCPAHALVLADPYLPDGTPAVSSRLALKQAIAGAAAIGLHVVVGMEMETFIYPLDNQPQISETQHFFSAVGQGLAAPLLRPILDSVYELGIKLQTCEHEHGQGQIEFNLAPNPALEAADQMMIFKLAAREILHPMGYGITWMAKLHNGPEAMTSGLHVHLSGLDANGQTVFYDPEKDKGLASRFLDFIGGQLAGARQIAALSTPTITGYKRYRPGTWAPTSATWSLDNRTSMVRVMPRRGISTRVENRLPEAAANPYLALAAMLAAGVDGIKRQTDPGPPIVGDAVTGEAAVPTNIREAAACLEENSAITELLGHDMLSAYRGILLRTADRFDSYVTNWEIVEYSNIL